MKQVGRRIRPKGWEAITSGTFVYSSDLAPEGLLVGRILRSPHPSARIVSIDVSAARAMPGVHAVITGADLPTDLVYRHEGAGDRHPIARGCVRFIGEEVAAVAAETSALADAALAAIKIVYEETAAAFTIDEARAENAPAIHQRPTEQPNVARKIRRLWGDLTAARENAPVSVSGSYWYPSQSHICMETNNTLARWDEDAGRLHLWTGTSAPALVVEELSHLLALAPAAIICHEIGVGGSFGSKSRISEHEVLAAVLARAARRPVLLSLSRREEFATTKTRHGFRVGLRIDADEQGRMHGLEGNVAVDNGAFVHSGYSVMSAGVKALGTLYQFKAVNVEAQLVDTSKQPGGQFRGYGSSQTIYALESLIDSLAEDLKIDPIDLRKRNANLPFTTTSNGARIQSARLSECLDAVRDAIGWDEKKAAPRPGWGVGVACGIHACGSYGFDGANRADNAIDFFPDGRIRVRFGGCDTGTGQKTILAQIAAEELGLDADKVEVLTTQSDQTPFDLGAWSSRGTYYSGNAGRKTARAAAERLKSLAAQELGNGPIELKDGLAICGDRSVPIRKLTSEAPEACDGVLVFEESFVEDGVEKPSPEGFGNSSATYSFAAHAAEVYVDLRTGKLRVVDYVAAHDIGTAINPTFVEGQIVGGAVTGIGSALGEEMIHEQGRLVTASFINYAMPRSADLPKVRSIIIEGGDPKAPYGAKGVGELCITPPGPAIANALYDAIGIRISDLPLTPDKILTALANKAGRRRTHHVWRRPSLWWTAFIRWLYPRGLFTLLHRWGPSAKPSQTFATNSLGCARDLSQAVLELRAGATPIGGGIDLLPLRQDGIAPRGKLTSLLEVREMQGIKFENDGRIVIGAGTTLDDVAVALAERCPIITQAIRQIASAQVRAMATVAGNLLQAKRCWFYRNGFNCYKRGGSGRPCYAVLGDHRFYHAVVDGHRCQAVTPSDLATVLIALDSTLTIVGTRGTRVLASSELYTGPGETGLQTDEILVAVTIPAAASSRRGSFHKLGLWEGDFGVASVAMTAEVDQDGLWKDPRIVLGALAPVPWRAAGTEKVLKGTKPTVASVRYALDKELNAAAHPLNRNGWKLDAVAGLAEHATEDILGHTHPVSATQ
jgi:CO/xanthine dehydrogenase Mo-binding subunit/CO/xanthine dehydrogenase FAD-binding subunit